MTTRQGSLLLNVFPKMVCRDSGRRHGYLWTAKKRSSGARLIEACKQAQKFPMELLV